MVASALRAVSRIDDVPPGDAVWPRTRTSPTRRTEWITPATAEPSGNALTEAVDEGWLVSLGPDDDVASRPGPLRGLSVAVKDNIDVAGLPVHNGTEGALWRHPTTSAEAWIALEEAGAHCVGKAAMHELAWGVITPQIGNPVDRARMAGGSSGGSAACVRAGVSSAALGTDTGGSLRIPAALCGVVSIRPTTGAIDMQGITLLAPEQDVVGPIAGDVATCAAMLEVLLGRDLHVEDSPGGSTQRRRVGVLAQPGPLDEATAVGYETACCRLEATGIELVPCDIRIHSTASSVSFLRILLSSARLHHDIVSGLDSGVSTELRTLLAMGWQLEEHALRIDRARAVLTAETARLFRENTLDAFLTPTAACVAPLRESSTVTVGGQEMAVPAALTRFTAWASVVGMPAITVPAPVPGLPVGVQIMAPPHRDEVCLELGRRIE
jgi:aspartyl-tRNA(Asn)/glutamyl-tRNA(Gln) amidotransferase subunit A